MLRPRVIVCLDVKDGEVVKGKQFKDLRNVGDPVQLATQYEAEGADEIVFLDVSASKENRGTLLDIVRRTAETLFIPLTVGGGVRSVEDIDLLLRAGADKVSINSAAIHDPDLLSFGAKRFGSQCIVASIDVATERGLWHCYTHGGSEPTKLEAIQWATRCEQLGAGEILLTSIDQDGARNGYDLDLTKAVVTALSVPVIASGGAGQAKHLRDAFTCGKASAALVAGILHDGITTVRNLKSALIDWGINVRLTEAGNP